MRDVKVLQDNYTYLDPGQFEKFVSNINSAFSIKRSISKPNTLC